MYVTIISTSFHLKPNHITINRNRKHEKKALFRKTSPTPLLIHKTHHPLTKLQALDAVIDQIESSFNKRLTIDAQIFASLLETCFRLRAIEQGSRVHKLIPNKLLKDNVGISSKLLRLYASCGHMENAHQLFDEMPKRNDSAFPWNSLISGYVELGLYEDALAIYFQMDEEGVDPDRFTFPRVLKGCGGIGSVMVGEEIHRHVVRKGVSEDGADMAVSTPSYTNFISDSCKATIYPTDCVQSLSPYSGTIKNSPRIMAQTALTVAQTQAQSGKSLVAKLFKVKETKANEHKALDDCLDQMSSSVDLLSQSVKELQLIGKNDGKSISWRISNVQTWVSAALTSQTTCLDAFENLNGKIKDEISSSVTKTEKVTSNALALVNKFSRENTI